MCDMPLVYDLVDDEDADDYVKIKYYWSRLGIDEQIKLVLNIPDGFTIGDFIFIYADQIIEQHGWLSEDRDALRQEREAKRLWKHIDDEEKLRLILKHHASQESINDWMIQEIDGLRRHFDIKHRDHEWVTTNNQWMHIDEFYEDFWIQFGSRLHEELFSFLRSKGLVYIQDLTLPLMIEFHNLYAARVIY